MTKNYQHASDTQTVPGQHPEKTRSTQYSMTSHPKHMGHTKHPATDSSQAEGLRRPRASSASSTPSVSSLSSTSLTAMPLAPVPLATARTAAILKTRARALARVTEQHGTEEAGLSIIAFLVDAATYALPASYVREVYRFKELTPLPGTPPSIAGIINVRGLMLAVVDVRPLLALPPAAQAKQDTVIILHTPDKELGILTQGLLGVHTIPASQLHPAPQTISGAQLEYVRGVTNSDLIVIDAEKLLSAPPPVSDKPVSLPNPIALPSGKERSGSNWSAALTVGQAA